MSLLDTLCAAFVAADHAEHVFAYHGHLLDAELAAIRYATPAEVDAICATPERHDAHVRACAEAREIRAAAERADNARRCAIRDMREGPDGFGRRTLDRLAERRMVAWAHGTLSTQTAIAVEHAHDFTGGRIDALPVSRIAGRRFRGIVFG